MYSKIESHLSKYIYAYLLAVVLGLSLAVRVFNLNYNSPFNDEATDLLIGKLGLFQRDWWTYNPSAWLAGSPYVYPVLSALAGSFGGVVGSRLLNVIFGVLTVEIIFAITLLLSSSGHPKDTLSGIIASVVVGASVSGIYISRLATYDIPSYYFLLCSLYFLLKTIYQPQVNGKYFFFSAVLLVLACLTKIIILTYVPLVIAISYFAARRQGKDFFNFWRWYFFLPLFAGIALYVLTNLNAFKTYAGVNATRDQYPVKEIINILWLNLKYLTVPVVLSSLVLLARRLYLLWMILVVAALWIVVPHLITQRALVTMEKGLFLSVAFLAPAIGIGLSHLISEFTDTKKYLLTVIMAVILSVYSILSYRSSLRFNHAWDNSNSVVKFLSDRVENGDKVLVESGGTAILAGYDRNAPTNFTTFDWFVYHGQTGIQAYESAIKDGYFKYIELERLGQQGATIFSHMHNVVADAAKGSYRQIYSQDGFVVYQRLY